MIAGFVLLSSAVGILAMGATFVLALPTWVMLLSYPAVSSLTLLLCAALWSMRASFADRPEGLQRQASHG